MSQRKPSTRLEAALASARRQINGLQPQIDRSHLAQKVRQGKPLDERERAFIADLLEGKRRPAHRPKSDDVSLKNDEIAQVYLYARVLHSDRQDKDIMPDIEALFGVKSRRIYQIIAALDPERRRNI
jgi:hypothetical protein